MKSSHSCLASRFFAAALFCLLPQATGFSQSYTIRPTCIPKSSCKVSADTFGYSDTNWRVWPGQARPEERNSAAVGGTIIPTPPAVPEQQLPHAETVPAKPSIPSGNPAGSILPPGPANGKTTPATPSRPDGTPGPIPLIPLPGDGSLGTPGGLESPRDLAPKPKTGGSGGAGVDPSKELLLPGGLLPDAGTPQPVTPIIEPKQPDKDSPVPKPSHAEPIVPPFQDLKPAAPSPSKSNKDSSLSPRRSGVVATEATPMRNDLPIQADWNASLGPETISGHQLQSTSFEQQSPKMSNPSRISALEGYCPVQLQDNDRWVAGNQRFRLTYQGQVFVFSSDTARKRFEATPEKYAPVKRGNDVVLATEENRSVPGNISHSAIWHGRLYLFSNSATLAAFRDDPARYTRANAAHQIPLQVPADSL